jgi:23S rRNA pseudouridine1911/1915/1917 synthase
MQEEYDNDELAEETLADGEQEGEFFEHFRIVVDKGQDLLRIDKFLQNRLEKTSRTKLQDAAQAGNILVNDKAVKSNYRIKPFDVISIVLPHPPRVIELKAENIPLDIVYEDDDVVIINKQAGLVVHPGYGNYTGTLVNGLLYHFENMPSQPGDLRPGLVHRLDKNTSGIMVMAKNDYALAFLAKQFFNRTTQRAYRAVVWGDVKEDSGTITGHIGRDVRDRKIMAVFPEGDQGKHAVTHYTVLQRFGYVTLIECRLETGRTHQIRAHMKHIGHPLFNDDTYGGDKILKGTTFSKYKHFIENCFQICPRHALHAKSLGFTHPTTGKAMFFDSELPADMQALLEKWTIYGNAVNLKGNSEEEE